MFPTASFKGHAVFVWKKSSGYSFAWLPDRDAPIPREEVLNALQGSECMITEWMKAMKGLREVVRLILIKDPHSHHFSDYSYNPMSSRDDFLDLIKKFEMLAKENQVHLLIDGNNNPNRVGF